MEYISQGDLHASTFETVWVFFPNNFAYGWIYLGKEHKTQAGPWEVPAFSSGSKSNSGWGTERSDQRHKRKTKS